MLSINNPLILFLCIWANFLQDTFQGDCWTLCRRQTSFYWELKEGLSTFPWLPVGHEHSQSLHLGFWPFTLQQHRGHGLWFLVPPSTWYWCHGCDTWFFRLWYTTAAIPSVLNRGNLYFYCVVFFNHAFGDGCRLETGAQKPVFPGHSLAAFTGPTYMKELGLGA